MNQISPIVTKKIKQKTMSFSSAVKEIVLGKKITKLEWSDENVYALLKDNILMLHKNDNNLYQWIINEGDLTGKDWIVLAH